MPSALQKEAERQVLSMHKELALYRQFMTSGFTKPGYMPNQPAWHVSHETFNGDFALDEVLAQKLAARLAPHNPEAGWLENGLDGERFQENFVDAMIGPGNIVGNLNSVRQAGEATLAKRKINSAAARIAAGKAQSVKINSHMTLYNANKSGKGSPRLRVKITRQPIKVFSPLFSDGAKLRPISRGGFSARGKDVKSMMELQGLTSKAHFFNGKLGGGVLTFAPTMAFDLIDSVHKDASGSRYINWHQFSNAEIKNQPGNAAGFAAGLATELVAVTLFGATAGAAPVILLALGVGIGAQILWNQLHMPEKTDNWRKKHIGE